MQDYLPEINWLATLISSEILTAPLPGDLTWSLVPGNRRETFLGDHYSARKNGNTREFTYVSLILLATLEMECLPRDFENLSTLYFFQRYYASKR